MTKSIFASAILAFALLAVLAISFAQGMDMGPAAAPLSQGGVLTPTNDTAMEAGGMHLAVSAFPLQAAVPRMSDFELQARYANGSAVPHVTFQVRLVQTEDDKVVFVTTLHDHMGLAHFSYGFNDGSVHRLEVTASQDIEDGQMGVAAPVHHEYDIDVQPQMPTLALQARLTVQLIFIFGIGALIGSWWGQREKAKRARHA